MDMNSPVWGLVLKRMTSSVPLCPSFVKLIDSIFLIDFTYQSSVTWPVHEERAVSKPAQCVANGMPVQPAFRLGGVVQAGKTQVGAGRANQSSDQ
jgi:hypothetical protein